MIKILKRQFILYTMLIISSILTLIFTFIFIGSDTVVIHRMLVTLPILLILVWIASVILANTAIKPIQDTWQKQLDFTADASHELRTPLAVIHSNLEIILDNPEATVASQEKWLRNIKTESERMNRLVEDLLTLSRADSEQTSKTFTELPLDIIIQERMEVFEPLAAAKHITLSYHGEHNLCIQGDISYITRLFTIFIDNALKYMGRPGTFAISVSSKGKKVQILISDNGVGIPSDSLDKIFSRFYRVDKARSRNETIGGFGLGLPIAKWIVAYHGGTISVQSVENQGTQFTILLPKK